MGEGEWDDALADVENLVLPALMHWQSPRFFGYFPCNSSWPAVLGDLLSTGLGVQGMLWQTGPACTELETRVLDWMADACGLPAAFRSTATYADGPHAGEPRGGGVIQGTASEATLVALVAARDRLRLLDPALDPRTLVAYCSNQAHSSVLKAARIAGIEHLRSMDVDEAFALDADALEAQLRSDVDAGLRPFYLCATSGTTSSGAFDPIAAMARLRNDHAPHAWLHVDAAWAGAATVCPEHRGFLGGLEHADSYCFNPHKWLLTSFDCDLFWTRDRRALTDALSVTPEYLRNSATEAGGVIDYRDWQIPLGRRFRALKLWFVLRHYGLAGLRAHIRQHVEWAAWLEDQIEASADLELAAPRSLSLVCIRLITRDGESPADADARTRSLLERCNATGRLLLTHTTLPTDGGERYAIRVSIGSTHTRRTHVEEAWDAICTLAADC